VVTAATVVPPPPPPGQAATIDGAETGAVPPSPPTDVADAAPPRNRGKLIGILIGAVVLVAALITAGIVIVPTLLAGSSGTVASSDTEGDEPQVVPTQSPTPSETPTAVPEDTPTVDDAPALAFRSNSGNIRCMITEESVICRQGDIKYPRPAQTCSPLGGATIGVDADGAYWPCIDSDFTPTSILAYETVASRYGFTCSITYATGVTCTNESGSGFQMEYNSGIYTF
jgi:hypothetical protein